MNEKSTVNPSITRIGVCGCDVGAKGGLAFAVQSSGSLRLLEPLGSLKPCKARDHGGVRTRELASGAWESCVGGWQVVRS